MNKQEREQIEFEVGIASELQNAYLVGKLTAPPDDAQKACDLAKAGRFVVVTDRTTYCQATDAINGLHRTVVGDYATHEEAKAAVLAKAPEIDDEESLYIIPPIIENEDDDLEDLPF